MDKSKLLDQCGALGDDRLLLARVLDRARQASERNVPAATDFLSPAQQAMAMDMLRTAGISDTAFFLSMAAGRIERYHGTIKRKRRRRQPGRTPYRS